MYESAYSFLLRLMVFLPNKKSFLFSLYANFMKDCNCYIYKKNIYNLNQTKKNLKYIVESIFKNLFQFYLVKIEEESALLKLT